MEEQGKNNQGDSSENGINGTNGSYYSDMNIGTHSFQLKLPILLRDIVNLASNPIEKDLGFLTSITIISALSPRSYFEYGIGKFSFNIMLFVIGPSGSGKGYINTIKKLYDKIELEIYKTSSSIKYGEVTKKNKKAKKRGLFLASDISRAELHVQLKLLDYNVIYSTEAITMNNKQEIFFIKDVLLKGFGNEPIFSQRLEKSVRVDELKVSMLISGTESSIPVHAKGIEDGMFNRILWYYLKQNIFVWEDKFNEDYEKKRDEYQKIQDKLLKLFKYLEENPFEFKLSDNEKQEFTEYFRDLAHNLDISKNPNFDSVIKRLAIYFMRIAAALSIFRRFERKCKSKEFYCTRADFEIAKSVVDKLLNHSKYIYDILKKRKPKGYDKYENIMKHLNIEFTRKDLEVILDKNGYSESSIPRTCSNILKYYKDLNKLEKIKNGRYRKSNNKEK